MPPAPAPDSRPQPPVGPGPAAQAAHDRFDRLDALRGAAIVWMVAFHFGFDLNHFGWLSPPHNFHRDPLWTTQRTVIVSGFLLCAGMGQAVALENGLGWARFWRRWAAVAGCAVLVSAGSALMFPRSWISFGVLHGMALMLLAARFAAPLRGGLWPLGALLVALPRMVQHPFFDTRLTNWVGLVTQKPVTEDWVPMLPWLGVMLWGLALGQWLLARQRPVLAGPLPRPLSPLALLGRWPLTVYMLHQPLLIGALSAWQMLAR
jgi:uncharacterized membrane protein